MTCQRIWRYNPAMRTAGVISQSAVLLQSKSAVEAQEAHTILQDLKKHSSSQQTTEQML